MQMVLATSRKHRRQLPAISPLSTKCHSRRMNNMRVWRVLSSATHLALFAVGDCGSGLAP